MNCPKCDCYIPPGTELCGCGYRITATENAAHAAPAAEPKPVIYPATKRIIPYTIRGVSTRTAARITFLIFLALFILAWTQKNRLPPRDRILEQLLQQPQQTKEDVPAPFTVQAKGISYRVTPQFRYELYGLVVSQHRSDSFIDIHHRDWQDYLNLKDICVVWGSNITSGVYRRGKFWNRDFTCMCQFKDELSFRLFSANELSNNHLLSADRAQRRLIKQIRRGDQIFFRGFLSSYEQPGNSFQRGTSVTRDDTGNGACETVFVTNLLILKRANTGWRILLILAIGFMIFCVVVLFML